MKLVLFGSGLVSTSHTSTATYYRGICRAMHERGHQIVLVEANRHDREHYGDLPEDPPYAEARVCHSSNELASELENARGADLVATCGGIGGWDAELAEGVLDVRAPGTLVAFWDVDAPRTLASALTEPPDTSGMFRALIPRYDLILLNGGGPPVQSAYTELGARQAHVVYNAVDPEQYHHVPSQPDRVCDLLVMDDVDLDRERHLLDLLIRAAELAPERTFVVGGNGWDASQLPEIVRYVGDVPAAEQLAWNCSARLVLSINHAGAAATSFSPSTRLFEAAACGSCIVTDVWRGMEAFFEPDHEILVAASADEIVEIVRATTPGQAQAIGAAARTRALRDHTYARRAADLEAVLVRATRRSSPA